MKKHEKLKKLVFIKKIRKDFGQGFLPKAKKLGNGSGEIRTHDPLVVSEISYP